MYTLIPYIAYPSMELEDLQFTSISFCSLGIIWFSITQGTDGLFVEHTSFLQEKIISFRQAQGHLCAIVLHRPHKYFSQPCMHAQYMQQLEYKK